MKKITLAFFAILTAGMISSCTKDNSVKPAAKTTTTVTADRTDVGSGD